MVWPFRVVPLEPVCQVTLKSSTVSDCFINVVVHKFILKDTIEAFHVGMDFGRSWWTPQVQKLEINECLIKHCLELTAIVCVDGMEGIRDTAQDLFKKKFGMMTGE